MSTFWVVPAIGIVRVTMGFQFRKSISIISGLKLNFSKSGISTSIGGRGAAINFSRRGTRTTVGLPGTGISYSALSPLGVLDDYASVPSAGSGSKGGSGCAMLLIGAILVSALGVIINPSYSPMHRMAVETIPAAEKLKVTANVLNCRAGPAVTERHIVRLTKGQIVSAHQPERVKGWVQLDMGSAHCWAAEHYLSKSEPSDL